MDLKQRERQYQNMNITEEKQYMLLRGFYRDTYTLTTFGGLIQYWKKNESDDQMSLSRSVIFSSILVQFWRVPTLIFTQVHLKLLITATLLSGNEGGESIYFGLDKLHKSMFKYLLKSKYWNFRLCSLKELCLSEIHLKCGRTSAHTWNLVMSKRFSRDWSPVLRWKAWWCLFH